MKLVSIVSAAAAMLLTVSSCGILGAPSTASEASSDAASATLSGLSSGKISGAALKSLYAQYRQDGKLDLKNVNNIINLASLANGVKGLKGTSDKTAFYADFVNGLINGSGDLVNQKNSSDVLSNLTKLAGVDLSSVAAAANALSSNVSSNAAETLDKVNTASSNVKTAVNSLNNIFNLFK